MKIASALLVSLLLGLAAPVGLGQETRSAEELLDALVLNEEAVTRLAGLVDQLGSDAFRTREAAAQKLMATPLIPAEVLKRGLASGDPEIVSRIERIITKGAMNRSSAVLDEALQLVEENQGKGLLKKIATILESGVRPNDAELAERAALATAEETDLIPIQRLAAAKDPVSQRMAAAAAEALGEKGNPLLRRMLKAEAPAVRLRAAISLGNLGAADGARALGPFLKSEDTVERVRAGRALRELTGKEFGYAALDPEADRTAAHKRWTDWLKSDDVEIVGRAGEVTWRRLFNGRDLAGWSSYRRGIAVPDANNQWKVEKGVLVCPGNGPGDLRTDAAFDNYLLVVRFRAPERAADSGVGVMLTPDRERPAAGRFDGGAYLEVQLLPNRCGDLYTIGGFNAQADGKAIGFSHPRDGDADDGVGEWHELRLEVKAGSLRVFVNDQLVNEATGGPEKPGKILLREEQHGFEFKEISLLPLEE
jgi:hypothetical protein